MQQLFVYKTVLALCYKLSELEAAIDHTVTAETIVKMLPIHSGTCLYCVSFNGVCNKDCRYGMLHGYCDDDGSTWQKLCGGATIMETDEMVGFCERTKIREICSKYTRILYKDKFTMDVNTLMGYKKIILAEIAQQLKYNQVFLEALEAY